jgi:hypothetical protein
MTASDHGSRSTYVNYGCRCLACTEAHSAAIAAKRARRTPADAAEHGTASTYQNYGCRCSPCRVAASAARNEWRLRKIAARDAANPEGENA